MSELTHNKLIEALTAHIADEDEDSPIVTGLVLVASVAGASADGTGYRFEVLEANQPAHVSRGLVSLLSEWVDDCTTTLSACTCADEDDD